MPLIVLTRGILEEEGPDGKAFAEEHRRDHAAIGRYETAGIAMVLPASSAFC